MSAQQPARVVSHGFVDFVRQGLGLELSPAQRVLWAVLADGAQPAELEGDDRDTARQLFGDVDEIPRELLTTAAIVKGARIGGSYLCALRLLDLALAVSLEGLAPGEMAFGVIVAPDLRLAQQSFRYVTGAIDSHRGLAYRVQRRTESSLTLARDDGRPVTVECLPATRGGYALRGRTLVGAVLDESAFFRDESYTVNDVELYKAVAPRIVPGGQLLLNSTPWAQTGLLYDLFTGNYGNPRSCVAVHAPTRLMRADSPTILDMVARESERDPDNAAREYGAEFMSAGSGLFFDPLAIDQAVEEYALPQDARGKVAVAVDAAFTRDASAFIAADLYQGAVRVLDIDEIKPAKGSPLQPSAVVARWAERAKHYNVRGVHGDVHYKEAIKEHLTNHRLAMYEVPGGQQGKRTMYECTRALLGEGRLQLPRHPELLRQLREVVGKPTPGGGMTITSPRRPGAHGDLVSALVAVVYALAGARGGQRIQAAMRALQDQGEDNALAKAMRSRLLP